MKKHTKIYLVRHGQSLGNINFEKGSGHLPNTEFGSDLSDLGKQQAIELSKKFKSIHLDAIYSSHLTRTKKTASPIAKQKKLKIIFNKKIREIEEENENENETLLRFLNEISQISKNHLGETVMVISHGIVIKLFIKHIDKKFSKAHLNNIGHIQLRYIDNTFNIIDYSGLDFKLH